MAMWVMHCLAVKLGAMFRRAFAASGDGSVITLAIDRIIN
jgi:hypothetical protein